MREEDEPEEPLDYDEDWLRMFESEARHISANALCCTRVEAGATGR